MSLKSKFKRTLSGLLSMAMVSTIAQCFPVSAEDSEKYPYTMFAASDAEGAITINANNFCVNGSIATNGTIVSDGIINVNGIKNENADENMIYIFDKIDTSYFSGTNVKEYSEDYILEELNININTPTEVEGSATFTGNININTALKTMKDLTLNGEVKNTNNSVLFSKYGDIIIDSANVNLNGLVYAPFGDVIITSQNLNFNNVVIIANSITLECPAVNANYNTNVGEFVGITSDALDIPYDEWQYMKDENENMLPDFFEDYNNWSKLLDTDSDGLPDNIEEYIGTDKNLSDTDGDNLPDGYEIFNLGTDPLLTDSNDNGISDGDEDFDYDGLTNFEEYLQKTDPYDDDTDDDGLSDGEELKTYNTNPLEPDTDFDGLNDGEEIYLGTNPTIPDTDSNGILDSDEKYEQTLEIKIDDPNSAVTGISVTMNTTGLIDKNTSIENIMGIDTYISDVVGLVGVPVDISSSSDFTTATISFYYDETLLGEHSEDDLAMMWYDEENGKFTILDDCVVDKENNIVSYETTHFSKYLLIDTKIWLDVWRANYNYRENSNVEQEIPYYDIAFVVDVSGSMSSTRLDTAKKAMNMFLDSMLSNDNGSLIKFNDSANIVSSFGNTIEQLRTGISTLNANGGTSVSAGLSLAIDELDSIRNYKKQVIILICDGDVNNVDALVEEAASKNIVIYTVNVMDGDSFKLSQIAEKTGGEYYKAITDYEIVRAVNMIEFATITSFEPSDFDEDGIPDIMEDKRTMLSNGVQINTRSDKKDTDDDGFSDGEELGEILYDTFKINDTYVSCVFFNPKSSPLYADSDGDYYPDCIDKDPLKWEKMQIFDSILNDSESIDDVNPTMDSNLYTDGKLNTQSIDINDDSNKQKNVLNFIRTNNNVHGIIQSFTLKPDKDSDYVVTLSNVSMNDYIKFVQNQKIINVKISYTTGSFKKSTVSVEQVSKIYFDAVNKTLSFFFALNSGITYDIDVVYEDVDGDYTISVSQNNWVYTPNGAIRKGDNYSKNSCLFINETFLTDAQICIMYDAITEEELGRKNSNDNPGMWAFENAEDFLNTLHQCPDEKLENFVKDNEITKQLSEKLEFIYADPTYWNGKYNDFSLNTSVLFTFAGSKQDTLLSVISSNGGNEVLTGLNVISALISKGYECKKTAFANALIAGKFNICIYENNTNPNNLVATFFATSGCGTWSSRSNVKGKYLNKYAECTYQNNSYPILDITETLRCNIILFDKPRMTDAVI